MRCLWGYFSLLSLLIFSCIAGEIYADPVSPEEAGVIPLTPNLILYQFSKDYARGGQPTIAILDNGNIAAAWQDNGSGIGGGWILLNEKGEILKKTIRSMQKGDGTPTAMEGMYFPLVSANQFGGGFLYGATYYDWSGRLHAENRMEKWEKRFGEENAPLIQRIDSNGEFLGSCFLGLPEDFVARKGQIRLADVGYLSDGNIALLAEDMQDRDGPELFNLPKANRVAIACIVNPSGQLLRGPIALHQSDKTSDNGVIWYGLAMGEKGFGARFNLESAFIRFFDNRLTPLSDDIPLSREFAEGGRGENIGWHGNGKNEFLVTSKCSSTLYFQIFNSRGTPKFEPHKLDQTGIYSERCDGAIDPDGRFVVAGLFLPTDPALDGTRTAIAARYFNPDGTPITPPFWVSSIPMEDWAMQDIFPRIALRDGRLAVVWLDKNTNLPRAPELAVRIFQLPK